MLPSDPDYIPAAVNEKVRQCPQYQELLALNTDPFSPYSYDQAAVDMILEFVFEREAEGAYDGAAAE
jgi:hypothetical protein